MKRQIVSIILVIATLFSLLSATAIGVSAHRKHDDPDLFWPVPGHNQISQGLHGGNAIDISDAHIEGANVIVSMGGRVKYVFTCAENHPGDYNRTCCYGFGNGIVIAGDDGRTYQYAHMLDGSIPSWIDVGVYLPRGHEIGKVGNTGASFGAHLHFGISNTENYWEEGPDPSKEDYDYITDEIDEPLDLGELFYARIVCSKSGKTLTVEGTEIILTESDNAGDQRWRFERQSDGSYHIYIYYSDYVLALADADSSDSDIDVEKNGGALSQSWYIYGDDGGYEFVSAQCGRVITVGEKGNGVAHLLDDALDFGYEEFDIQIHKYTENVVEPTDFTDGYTEYTCNCGDYYKDNILSKFNPFDDINPGKWYTDGVLYCFRQSYMAGISENEFGYKDLMDRQMFATILAKIDGADTSSYTDMSFGDVASGKWYSQAVEWAYRSGYASGVGTDETGKPVYGRKNPVTREQLALFFYTYSEKKGYDVSGRADLSGFEDLDSLHSWAADGMAWAVDAGLVSGTSKTTLSPRDSATRATVALIIKNYVETVAGQ